MFTKNITKDLFSTLIGAFVVLYAISCYMFNFPNERDLYVNMMEAGLGFVLFFIDGNTIAQKLFSFFEKRLSKKP